MKIELGEHNGFLSPDLIPTLIILKVTTDNGKQIQFPYPADRTIQDLYRDLVGSGKSVAAVAQEPSLIGESRDPDPPPVVARSGEIEKGDIVQLVQVPTIEDDIHEEDLILGEEYRVLSVVKIPSPDGKESILVGYDIIYEKSKLPHRISVPKRFVTILRKGPPPVQQDRVMERISKCEKCGKEVALALQFETGMFSGLCVCGEMKNESAA